MVFLQKIAVASTILQPLGGPSKSSRAARKSAGCLSGSLRIRWERAVRQ